MDDLLHNWDSIDLSQDAWLAYTFAGELVGYAAVLPWGHSLRYEFYVDPNIQETGPVHALLERCERRGELIAGGGGDDVPLTARIYLADTNNRDRSVVEQAGFKPVRYHFQMEASLAQPLPTPRWPEGVSVRNFKRGSDEQAVYDVIEQAFTRPDRIPVTFEVWQSLMLRPGVFDPGLWLVAQEGDRIIGACLGFEDPDRGWVRQLAVDQTARGRGVGAALLLQAFAVFKQRGFERVGLGVEANNRNALEFYEKIGMHRVRQYNEYEKSLLCIDDGEISLGNDLEISA